MAAITLLKRMYRDGALYSAFASAKRSALNAIWVR